MAEPLPPTFLERDRSSLSWQSRAPLLWAAALVVLRVIYQPWINLFPEEAYYWNYAQHLDIGYLDHPPMVAWLIALGTRLFGQSEFGVRAPALACSLLTSFFAFRLTALLYGRRAAGMAVLLVQLLPFFFMTSWIMTPDAPLTACWAGTLYFLVGVIFKESRWAWLGVGISLGLGMLSKYTIALLGPAALLFLALDPPARAWLRRPAPYLAAGLALAIFSPVIGWNAAHRWASFAFQSTGRLKQEYHFGLPALLGSVLLMLTPAGVFLAGRMVSPQIAPDAAAADAGRHRRRFAWVFTLVPLAVFVAFSITHPVKLNWTGPLWLALVPMLAAQTVAGASFPLPGRRLRRSCLATGLVLTVLYWGLLQYLVFGLPGVPYARNIDLLPVGWPQMADELARQQALVRRQTGGRVLIVGMDRNFIASEVAFYHPDRPQSTREVTAAQLFGDQSLMYAYWFPPAAQDGVSLVLASFKEEWLHSGPVRRYCEGLEAIQTHQVTDRGHTVCTYYTRVVRRYHAPT